MYHWSPYHAAGWRLLLFLFFAVGAAAVEDCGNPGSTLKDALADDGDLPLSLMQVKAIATRNNKTHHANQSLSLEDAQMNATLRMLPGSHFIQGLVASGVTSETLRAFYFAIAVLILILVVNSSMLYAQLQRQETRKKQSVPKVQLPVDHFVATSKLNLGTESMKSQLRFYTRVQRSSTSFFNGTCPSRVSSTKKPSSEDQAVAETPTPGHSLDEQRHGTGEALDAKLILPLRETWYAVAIEQVLKADGTFEILRITGCPSLRASVCYNGGGCGGTLELFCCSGGATKHLLARASTRELKAQGDAHEDEALGVTDAEGRWLGELRRVTCKSFELARNGKAVVTLAADDAGQLELSSVGGSRLACVSCLAGHLGICVNAGADTGLVICLVLAAVLLGGAGAYVLPKGGDGKGAVRDVQVNKDTCEPTTCTSDQ